MLWVNCLWTWPFIKMTLILFSEKKYCIKVTWIISFELSSPMKYRYLLHPSKHCRVCYANPTYLVGQLPTFSADRQFWRNLKSHNTTSQQAYHYPSAYPRSSNLCSEAVVDWHGPRLMTDTQHSTLKTQCIWMEESWVWSVNPECIVLSIHHKFWVQALNLWRFISTIHFKLQHQIHVFGWGILKCGRIHILRSGISNQLHGVLSVECWVSVISLGHGETRIFVQCSCLIALLRGYMNHLCEEPGCSYQTLEARSPIDNLATLFNLL